MYKLFVFAAILAIAFANPEAKADPKPEAKPGIIAAAYSAPIVAAPVTYTAAYSAPLTYAAAPLAYSAYPAYSAYAASYVAYL
ncbi:unnamed protein product [Ceutorhynchus assimilis]|uniref:Uncharacterized protein n=1 Tax=Ceutorhynchus assimilis TaxID=467358 RepID=A0A9N9MR72_9CUCU|nr:unnamed protein product [Ceutorhynchus assimilis]